MKIAALAFAVVAPSANLAAQAGQQRLVPTGVLPVVGSHVECAVNDN